MTSANLKLVARRHLSGGQLSSPQEIEENAAALGKAIELDIVNVDIVDQNTGRAGKATIGFTIAYRNPSPRVAHDVLTEVVDLFLEESANRRARGTAGAVSLLSREARQLQQEIADLEESLAKFKEANAQSLPDLRDYHLRHLEMLKRDLVNLQRQIRDLEDRKGMREADLATIIPNLAIYTADGKRLFTPEEQLEIARAEYASKSAKYSPRHPDIVSLRQVIKGLETHLEAPRPSDRTHHYQLTNDDWKVWSQSYSEAQQVHAVKSGDTLWRLSRKHDVSVRKLARANGIAPTATLRLGQQLIIPYGHTTGGRLQSWASHQHPDARRLLQTITTGQQETLARSRPGHGVRSLVTSRDNPSFLRARAELEAMNRELALMTDNTSELRDKITEYEKRLALTPQVETQLSNLLREHETATERLHQIRDRQLDAQLAESIEKSGAGARFSLAEPPLLPSNPDQSNRVLLLLLSFLLSSAASAAFVLLREKRQGTIHDARSLKTALNVTPLVVIPETGASRRPHLGFSARKLILDPRMVRTHRRALLQ